MEGNFICVTPPNPLLTQEGEKLPSLIRRGGCKPGWWSNSRLAKGDEGGC
jgi:hypothetical protein